MIGPPPTLYTLLVVHAPVPGAAEEKGVVLPWVDVPTWVVAKDGAVGCAFSDVAVACPAPPETVTEPGGPGTIRSEGVVERMASEPSRQSGWPAPPQVGVPQLTIVPADPAVTLIHPASVPDAMGAGATTRAGSSGVASLDAASALAFALKALAWTLSVRLPTSRSEIELAGESESAAAEQPRPVRHGAMASTLIRWAASLFAISM